MRFLWLAGAYGRDVRVLVSARGVKAVFPWIARTWYPARRFCRNASTRRSGLRLVVRTSVVPKRLAVRERILPTCGRYVSRLWHRGSATCFEGERLRAPAGRILRLESTLGRGVLPGRRPTRGSTRQDAECRARRPSRLVCRETDGVTPLADAQRQLLVHRGKRRAASVRSRVNASCG
jgi:hypothetical protein